MIKSHGIAQKFDIEVKPYTGLDFSKLAFLFCGQGQMLPGIMREEALHLPLFQPYFKELDRRAVAAGFAPPSQFILSPEKLGPGETLGISSLALYGLQVAMHDTLQFSNYKPSILSAHSFGEFAMLTAAGVLDFGSMVDFLILRQKALSRIGGRFVMLAVNGAHQVQFSTDIEYYPANYNSLLQTSYVCRAEDADALRAVFKENRLASVPVDVDYPYHTPWLKPAHQELEGKMAHAFTFKAPKIPFISSVTGRLIDEKRFSENEVRRLLVDQLITPVHFPEQIRGIVGSGVSHFMEIAPVDVLTPFVEQVLSSDKAPFKVDSFRKRIKVQGARGGERRQIKNSKILDVFNKALKSLSGYSVEDIQLEDRIREDLGIDSIKKADIVFQMIENMSGADASTAAPVNLADLATFGDVLDFLENSLRAKEKMVATSVEKRPVFDLVKRDWRPVPRVDFSSGPVTDWTQGSTDDLRAGILSEGESLVLHWSSEDKDKNPWQALKEWLRFFKEKPLNCRRLVFVHPESPTSNLLNALFITWTQELGMAYKSIRFNGAGSTLDLNEIYLEALDFYQTDVRITATGERFVRDYQLTERTEATTGSPRMVAVFGGLGGVGAHCIEALRGMGLEQLTVIGRSSKKDVEEKWAALKGIAPKVEYVSLDVTDRKALDGFLAQGYWDLVVHSVGYEVSETLANTTDINMDRIIDGKCQLADSLADWAKRNLKSKVIFNSSIIPEFGNLGQSTYAVANQRLNDLADQAPNILALMWPAWKQTGMANHELITRSLYLQGLPVLEPRAGGEIFKRALNLKRGVYLVICPDYIDDYLSASPLRQDFKNLFKVASKNRQLYALTGLTQKNLPYLTHHIVKKICPFPASGSISLMLFRGYQERGQIGRIRNFSALNFLIVNHDTSNFLFEATFPERDQMYMQVRSAHPLADGYVDFSPGEPISVPAFHFECDQELEFDFDQNVAVSIGDLFKVEQGIFVDTRTGRMVVRTDLEKTPRYTGVPIIDKFHKLLELSFNTSCLKSIYTSQRMIVPKSVEEVRVFNPGLADHMFFVIADNIESQEDGPVIDLWVVNSLGEPALYIRRLRSIVVGQEGDETAKNIESRPYIETFF